MNCINIIPKCNNFIILNCILQNLTKELKNILHNALKKKWIIRNLKKCYIIFSNIIQKSINIVKDYKYIIKNKAIWSKNKLKK